MMMDGEDGSEMKIASRHVALVVAGSSDRCSSVPDAVTAHSGFKLSAVRVNGLGTGHRGKVKDKPHGHVTFMEKGGCPCPASMIDKR
jgi:hypothetical protein